MSIAIVLLVGDAEAFDGAFAIGDWRCSMFAQRGVNSGAGKAGLSFSQVPKSSRSAVDIRRANELASSVSAALAC